MFRLVLYDNSVLKSAFNGIGQLVEELQVRVDHEGIRCDALDKSHVTFVHLDLRASLFDEFSISEPLSLNIDTGEFMKVLGRCKPKDILILEADDGNLIFTFEGDSTRTFKIRLIDLEYETPVPPSIEHPFSCILPVNILKDAISDVGVFSDKIYIRHDEEEDYLYLSGEDGFGATTCKYLIDAEDNGTANSVYALDKLKDFMKSEKFSDTIIVRTGVDIPLVVEFRLSTGDGVLSYLLAPRIEQEE